MNNHAPPKPVHIGVGIDTARYAHHVSFLDEEKRTATKPFHFTEAAAGYQKLQDAFDRLAGKHPNLHLHIRIDAAGQYAENLLQWLHQLDLNTTISVGQPARNKAYRKVHFDKRKADPTESLACARFAIVERPAPRPITRLSSSNSAIPWLCWKSPPSSTPGWSTSCTACWPVCSPNWRCSPKTSRPTGRDLARQVSHPSETGACQSGIHRRYTASSYGLGSDAASRGGPLVGLQPGVGCRATRPPEGPGDPHPRGGIPRPAQTAGKGMGSPACRALSPSDDDQRHCRANRRSAGGQNRFHRPFSHRFLFDRLLRRVPGRGRCLRHRPPRQAQTRN